MLLFEAVQLDSKHWSCILHAPVKAIGIHIYLQEVYFAVQRLAWMVSRCLLYPKVFMYVNICICMCVNIDTYVYEYVVGLNSV